MDLGRKDIRKEEASRRLLDEAVRMLFENRDGISAHVIGMAGSRIAHDVCKAKGIESFEDEFEKKSNQTRLLWCERS